MMTAKAHRNLKARWATLNLGLNLKVKCHVNKNGDGDRFVGIKADANQAMVYFPMGIACQTMKKILGMIF